MGRSHGMSSETASQKKIQGHQEEQKFATVIDGFVCKTKGGKGKKDIVDREGYTYSLKTGIKFQIFLYSKSRFRENTEFKGFKLTPIFLLCFVKEERGMAMELLKDELQDETLRKSFLSKSIFNSNEVDRFIVKEKSEYKIWERECVLEKLLSLRVCNTSTKTKVLFKSDVNVGEIEYRGDGNKDCIKFLIIKKSFLELMKDSPTIPIPAKQGKK